ncbi:MAG: tRNA-dihydrouridine synthase family protein, partial [Bdellovibrionales bacterium]|nr:tRNA-dihydrouridine synthase family protein [Bdellovibrionales bacterium]
SIQIFGNPIERMVDAAIMIEQAGAEIVDINCGCPVPKVVKKGGGCELMRQPEHLEKILRAIRRAISIPLTVKIRSGWDEQSKNALAIARMAQDCGVSMIAVHGRTRQALYRGEADWSIVGEIARQVSIPVIGSGDVCDAQSAVRSLSTGVHGLMIGRGALANPWIFSEIAAALRGEAFTPPPPVATVDILEEYLELLTTDLPEKAVIGRMKQFASQVTRRVRGSTPARRALCTAKSVDEFRTLLKRWRDYLQGGSADEFTSVPEAFDADLSRPTAVAA